MKPHYIIIVLLVLATTLSVAPTAIGVYHTFAHLGVVLQQEGQAGS